MNAAPLPTHPFLRHPRTGRPLVAVGWSRRGPIWPVLGGDGTDDGGTEPADDTSATDGDGQDPKPDADPLREEGKQAIARMKEREKTARDTLRPWTSLASELGVKSAEELKALVAGKQKNAEEQQQADVDRIRREAAAEATAKANARIVRAEVKALAAETFADAADAAPFLDLSQYEVDDNGDVDADQIRDDLKALLQRKPHLAKPDAAKAPKGPKPDPAQGSKQPAPPRKAVDAGADLYRSRHPQKITTS